MIPRFTQDTAFYEARRVLQETLVWRRLRNLSLAIAKGLAPEIGKEKSDQLAEQVTGTEPVPWLSVSEAKAELERLGVRFSIRSLQRLARRARLTREGWISCWLNTKGERDGENSPTLVNPVVAIVARLSDGVGRYMVCPLSRNDTNHDRSPMDI